MMKMRQDNNMTDHEGPLYTENETELLWLIQQEMVYDEDQTIQQCDWSYKYGLRWNQNWTIMTDQIGCCLSWKIDRTMM